MAEAQECPGGPGPAPAPPELDARGARPEAPQGGESIAHAAGSATLEALGAAWTALGLTDFYGASRAGPRELTALRNRMQLDGVGLDELEDAIAGAGRSEWLRGGRAKRAFAVVFADAASVRRFAAEGRQGGARARAPVDDASEQTAAVARRQAQIRAAEELAARWALEDADRVTRLGDTPGAGEVRPSGRGDDDA